MHTDSVHTPWALIFPCYPWEDWLIPNDLCIQPQSSGQSHILLNLDAEILGGANPKVFLP